MEAIETLPDRDTLLTHGALQCAATELGANVSDLQITSVSGELVNSWLRQKLLI